MKVSIITISYNSAKTIEDTIESVLSQKYKNIEYIVVDGGSVDGTLDIINKYKDKIDTFMSEKDNGIYDAMNKGIELSTGEVIGFLNSDDFYKDKDVIDRVMRCFIDNNIDACYGNIEYIDRKDKNRIVRKWVADEYGKSKLNRGWIPPHPAFFVKKEIYKKNGKFNLDFNIAADYELMLRFLLNGASIFYINSFLVYMREGGVSASSIKQRRKGWDELKKAWSVNGLRVPRFFIIRRILFKIKQFL